MSLKKLIILTMAMFTCLYCTCAFSIINIVAAENVYGVVAKQLGGDYVHVVNILDSPSGDPHLFTFTPSIAMAATVADIIIYNGIDYDPWMKSVLAIKSSRQKRSIIEVANLVGIKTGDNPHIWYHPDTIPKFAKKLVKILINDDPLNKKFYEQQLTDFNNEYQVIFKTVKRLKQTFQNTPVIATESVFNYMLISLGLRIHGLGFQLSIMNGIPPSASQIKQFEDDLNLQNVRALIYNSQVISPLTKRMLAIARKNNIFVLGISEILPANTLYVAWVMAQLKDLEQGLDIAMDKAHG